MNVAKAKLQQNFEIKWSESVILKPKLRTYSQIKHGFASEPYVTCRLDKNQRSLIAQLRSGILPLAIEVGRFQGIPEENRLCEMCDLLQIETESHFLLYCTKYEDLRIAWFQRILNRAPEVFWYSDYIKLEWLFTNDPFGCGNFISKAWSRRQKMLFN